MAEHNNSMAVQSKVTNTVSRSIFFISVGFAVVIGFVAGTRSDDIYAAVAPLVGIKAESGTVDLSSVQSTYRQLKAHFDGDLDEQALIDGANRGLVSAAGDEYTVFLDAKESEEFEKSMSGEIGGGVGLEIGRRNDQPTVVRVLDNNPAKEAGILVGDTIIKVNGEPTIDWTTSRVADVIRGEIGTSVAIEVLRNGKVEDFSVTRREVKNPSVRSSIQDRIGYLTITRFDDSTASMARSAADEFKSAGVKAVVLDLRGNGGGYLEAAREVAGIWLDNKVVVSERSGGKVVDELKSGRSPILDGVKTVVVVDGSSASASEIVAGALKDHGAARLLGETTFGKGTVQKVIRLKGDSMLKVTVASWFTPNGKNISKEGIEPHTKVKLSPEDANAGRDPQLDAATRQVR